VKSAAGADDDALVEQWYDDEERTILLRYLRLSAGDEFQLAAVEVPTPAVREALLSWLRARAPDRPLIEVSLKGLPGSVLVEEITAALPPPSERSPRAVLALTDLEEVRGAATESHPSLFMRLNLERDPLVRALPLTCLLLAHPVALLKLRTVAPDFSHYFSTLVRQRRPAESAPDTGLAPRLDPSPSASLDLSDSDWPTLLLATDHAIARSEHDRARDHIAEFRATPDAAAWAAEARLLEGALEGATKGARTGLATLAKLDAGNASLRPATRVRLLLKRSEFEEMLGEREASAAHLEAARIAADQSGRQDLRASVLVLHARRIARSGAIDEAFELNMQARVVFESSGRVRDAWNAAYRALSLKGTRGDWAAVLDGCDRWLIPVAREVLRDEHLLAVSMHVRANALSFRGEIAEALRIDREQLMVFERLGDARTAAEVRGNIAGHLGQQGDWKEALRLRLEGELPVYERLGLGDEAAITHVNVGYLLSTLGRHVEAFAHLERARHWFDLQGSVGEQVEVRMGISRECLYTGNHQGAVREARDALSLAETTREPAYLLRAANHMASLLLKLRRVVDARAVHEHVATILAEDARWEALTQLDKLRATIDRASAPAPAPASQPRKRRR
jgi:tetratricopeptide (TPR) repeat protein